MEYLLKKFLDIYSKISYNVSIESWESLIKSQVMPQMTERSYIMATSQTVRVLEALSSGEELTAKQIANRFSVGNPHEVVRQIRMAGYPVYLNKRTNSKGETKGFYRLGTATREMVSSFYRTFGNA